MPLLRQEGAPHKQLCGLPEVAEQNKYKVTFIDESLYLDLPTNTWWIDSGATVHVANSLQRFHMKRTLPKGERSIRVANGLEVGVDAIGDIALELDDGFILFLRNVLFVPSMRRNLISILCLDDEWGWNVCDTI